MALSYQQDQRMRRFQDKHFTPNQVEQMEYEIDKEYPGVSYHWYYWLGNTRYDQCYDLRTKKITLEKSVSKKKIKS